MRLPLTICFAAIAWFTTFAVAQQQKLHIAIEGANPPFSTITANGTLEGFDVDIAKALCARMQADCIYTAQDWDGIIPALLSKKHDAIVASMSVTEDRKKVIAFTKPYYRSPSVFLVRKGTVMTSFAPADMIGKSIGVQTATNHAQFLEDKYPRSRLRLYNTIADAYRDLSAGRVDSVVYDKLAIVDWLRSAESACCEIAGPELTDVKYFGAGMAIGLRKNDTVLQTQLNAAIDGIVADGTYAQINAKYFPFPIF